jgi:hypothetical protein
MVEKVIEYSTNFLTKNPFKFKTQNYKGIVPNLGVVGKALLVNRI